MSITFGDVKGARDDAEVRCTLWGARLQLFPKGPMNLTPDNVKQSPEFGYVKAQWDAAFMTLRAMNSLLLKHYAEEMRNERRNREVVRKAFRREVQP